MKRKELNTTREKSEVRLNFIFIYFVYVLFCYDPVLFISQINLNEYQALKKIFVSNTSMLESQKQ